MCLKKEEQAISKYTNKTTMKELFRLYEEQIFEEAEDNKELEDKIVEAEKVFCEKLTEEQKKEFEQLCDMKQDNIENTEKNIFCYGFGLAVRLIMETYSIKI